MSDDNKGFFSRIGLFFLAAPISSLFIVAILYYASKIYIAAPISSLFIVAILYYASKIYILGGDTLMNRAILYGLFVLWGVYFVVRHLFKTVIVLAVIGGIGYGIYAYSQKEIKKCEDSGGQWNEKTQTCEYETSFLDKVKKLWQDFSIKINDLSEPEKTQPETSLQKK